MAQHSKRHQIQTLLEAEKCSIAEIANQVGVARYTVYRLKNRIEQNEPLVHKKGGGRPANKCDKIKYSCAKYIQHDAQKPVREIASEIHSKSGISVSKSTVHRCLKGMGYSKPYLTKVPMLSEKNRLNRIEWAKRNKGRRWFRAVFSDEASFWLRSGRVRMWTKGSQKKVLLTVKHSPKIHIWAAFSAMGTFPLCIFTQNLDAKFFVHILKWHSIDQARAFHGDSWILIQDNDPKHTSRLAKSWMEENIPKNRFDWPSQSPDLNPIENIFGWMKHKLQRIEISSINDLKAHLEELWESITPEFLEPYYRSMKRRCEIVIENEGYSIKY